MTVANDIHSLLFDVRRSVLYHNKRVNFYLQLNKWANVLTMALSLAIVYSSLSHIEHQYITVLYAFIATALLINILFSSSHQVDFHSSLAKQFIRLEQKIVSVSQPEEENIIDCKLERLDIEINEPPVLRVLDTICHNEMVRSMGCGKQYLVEIAFYQRLLSPIVDIQAHVLQGKT